VQPRAETGGHAVEFRGVTKSYGSLQAVRALDLHVGRGELVTLLGPSGSGKTTTLMMAAGFAMPDAGRILLNGRDVTSTPPQRRNIGVVFQSYALFPHRTVAENIATVPRLLGWEARRIEARVRELLEVFALDPATYADALPHQLSGGQQQRVGVARALAAEPLVVLMDEPFGALDPIIRAKAQDDLLDIQRRFGMTVVLVTHDMDEAFRLGHQVAVMSGGRLLQYDRPAVLLTQPADPFVARMTGLADRAMRLLSLVTAGEAALPGASDGPVVPPGASLREVLSELLWRGADSARVVEADGTVRGRLTVAAILARGRP
jgi:osmoprotectant transport system ATP-binding protein